MFAPTRRNLLGGAFALAATAGVAHGEAAGPQYPDLEGPQDPVIPLWPGTPPGGKGVRITPKVTDHSHGKGPPRRTLTGIATPRLIVMRPARPNGSAIMTIPGGGYSLLAFDNAGTDIGKWLTGIGVTTFILVYRLPGEGWANRSEVPLQDAQRAMRLIRANAGHFGIDPKRVGVIGFSAGGHLSGSLATMFDRRVYDPVDKADQLSARPDLAGMLYPVVTMGPNAHVGSRDKLLGNSSTPAERRKWSVQDHVSQGTPPVFLCNAEDDPTVPPINSLLMYEAMKRARRPAELHAYEKGGHGFGIRLPHKLPASHWPDLFSIFMRYNGLLT